MMIITEMLLAAAGEWFTDKSWKEPSKPLTFIELPMHNVDMYEFISKHSRAAQASQAAQALFITHTGNIIWLGII